MKKCNNTKLYILIRYNPKSRYMHTLHNVSIILKTLYFQIFIIFLWRNHTKFFLWFFFCVYVQNVLFYSVFPGLHVSNCEPVPIDQLFFPLQSILLLNLGHCHTIIKFYEINIFLFWDWRNLSIEHDYCGVSLAWLIVQYKTRNPQIITLRHTGMCLWNGVKYIDAIL